MTTDNKSCNIFLHGATWLRADFHLHTRVDKEFSYSGEDTYFAANYVEKLGSVGIRVGAITNHNKFDMVEFKELRRAARKKEILLLPGVEISVNDGANGVHTLVIFSEAWIEGGNDYINPLLTVLFEGKTPSEYEHENGRSSLGLIETIKKLEAHNKDFFLIFAHVEQSSGLWKELDGGRLKELGTNEFFRRRSLGFQKVRTHDKPDTKCRMKVKQWLSDCYPAEVEGSDCKSMEEIGKGKCCFIKIGDFSFEAVKYALLDHDNRLASEPNNHDRSHILSATFEGGVLNGKTIHFSPELNTLIGIRGSGKSSILEAIRYVLDIPFGDKSLDKDYKERLVGHVLGSGGKISIQAVDRRGKLYEIRRIHKETPDVYVENELHPGISIRETILHKPMYFGQKDLSSTGVGFEKDLVEKLIGEKLTGVRGRIKAQCQIVSESIVQLKSVSTMNETKKDCESKILDAEFKLTFYKEHGVDEKLKKQIDFEADSTKCAQVISIVTSYLNDMERFINKHSNNLINPPVCISEQNEKLFKDFFSLYDQLVKSFSMIRGELLNGKRLISGLKDEADKFETLKGGLKEEFAEIERKLAEELKSKDVKAIRPDEFRDLHKLITDTKQMLEALDKQDSQRDALNKRLLQELARLNDLWHEEYKEINGELKKVNDSHSSLEIKTEYKGDKDAFVSQLKKIFRGSHLRETTLGSLADEFSDFGAMYKELDKAKIIVGNSAQVYEERFDENLSTLLTWQVPNRFVIEYRGKELKHHSLGQRASALILFVLSQRENDVIIIDQPEDDLDNQTIYEDVIKLIRSMKPNTQFIFATHNANFPVLGDAEQGISCTYSDDAISVTSGSIDCPDLQQEIVDIMEGGEEAFNRRKKIYGIWKTGA
jgi:chromosome segregation protein